MSEETKGKVNAFMGKVKSFLDRSVVASKKALGVAGDAVQDFSDKSVLRIEKIQLETKVKKQYELLGEYVAKSFASKKTSSVSAKDEKVSSALKEIARLNAEIAKREEALKDESGAKKAASKTQAKTSAAKTTAVAKTSAKPASKTAAKAPAKKSTVKTEAKAPAKKTTAKPVAKTAAKKAASKK